MVRRYDIPGSKTGLFWGLGLALVCGWCIKDGWFPAESVLAKHPPGEDGFYLFNQGAAILTGIGSLVALVLYRLS